MIEQNFLTAVSLLVNIKKQRFNEILYNPIVIIIGKKKLSS